MKKNRTVKELLRLYSYGLFVVLLGFAITYQFIEPAPPTKLTIAAGSKGGAYLKYAHEYQKLLALNGISLKVLETAGSKENLSLLATGKVDIALMQSGVAKAADYPTLLGIGSLYYEPLWVFTRPGFTLTNLSQLSSQRIIMGPEGSGTRQVVLQLLADNGVDPAGLQKIDLTGKAKVEALRQGQVDVLFTITATSSVSVNALFRSRSVSLVSFARADAYTKRHNYLSKITLSQGLISLKENIPAQDVTLVAPTATLVTTENLHPALAGLMTQIIDKVHSRGSLLDIKRHQFPSGEYLDFPLSDDARRFYRRGVPLLQRYLPFWAAIQLDRLKLMLLPLLALLLPLFKILPLTYRWRMRSRVYRWYDTLQVLDYEVRQSLTEENVKNFIERLSKIEEDVRKINVPLAYAAELYSLRLHIDLLRRQIGEIKY
jgi:TRAP transporter TAXI family solute receptor